jgi:acylphosphatase
MVTNRYIISGRVQGVFFRVRTQQKAAQLGLTGWVRNRHDSRVEVMAQGDAAALAELENWLQTGPKFAKVSNIECIPDAVGDENAFTDFVIRSTV